MFRLTLRSLLGNKIRFFLTALSVVLGVTFVVSAFVVTDGLRSTFNDLSSDIFGAQDLTVQPSSPFGDSQSDLVPLPESVLDDVLALDSVDNALGSMFVDGTFPIDDDGEVPDSFGPPLAGVNWTGNTELDQFVLLSGEAPVEPNEFVIDQTTFDEGAFTIGQQYSVISQASGIEEFTLTGTIRFGVDEDSSVGARFTAFETETAQRFLGREDSYDSIAVSLVPDASIERAQAEIDALLPANSEVVTGEESEDEFNDQFEGFIGPFRTILLTFAFVVLFVSAFLINNTFNIIVGQRIRELGLLRAIGAAGRQVRMTVLGEAVLVGLFSTAVGLGLGLLGARALIALLESQGAEFPDGPMPLEPRTIIWALVVGVLVTTLSAFIPARRASTISPMEALRESSNLSESKTGRRTIIGGIIAAAGIAGTLFGLFGSFDSTTPRLIVLGVGAVLAFIAVAILSPLIVEPLAGVIGAPMAKFFGAPGRLARSNAMRSPERTAGTAVALTIGLALVSTVTIIGASLKDTVSESLSNSVNADYVVTSFGALPNGLLEEVAALPEISATSGFGGGDVLLNGEAETVSAIDFATFDSLIDAELLEGSFIDGGGSVALFDEKAEELGLGIGDSMTLGFKDGRSADFTVGAIFGDNSFLDSINIDDADYHEYFSDPSDFLFVAKGADGVSAEQSRAAIDSVVAQYPQLDVQDQAQYLDEIEGQIDQLLAIINVFLGLAVLIALIGIINTLTLSVFERTRELGLLRAVGMTRRQTRRMIRWESVIVAVFGGILGIALGVLFGYAISTAIPSDVIASVKFPIGQLVSFIVVAIIAGLLAAILPARRAARLNILEAIAQN